MFRTPDFKAYIENIQGGVASYSSLQKLDKIIANCSKYIHNDPECALAYSAKGVAIWESELQRENTGLREAFKRAKEALDKAIEIDNNCEILHTARGIVINEFITYVDLEDKKLANLWSQSDRDAIKAKELGAEFPLTHLIYAQTHLAQKETTKDAIEACSKGIEINPKLPNLYWYRGSLLEGIEEFSNAIDDYMQYLRLNKKLELELWWRWKHIGNVSMKWEQYRNAIDYYNHGIKLVEHYLIKIWKGVENDPYVEHWGGMNLLSDFQTMHVREFRKNISPSLAKIISELYGARAEAFEKVGKTREAKRDRNIVREII